MSCLVFAFGCNKTELVRPVSNKNVSWSQEIELKITWPDGVGGKRGLGVYSSLLSQLTPSFDLDDVVGDYLVVADRFSETSEGTVTILVSTTLNRTILSSLHSPENWLPVGKAKVECPEKPTTQILANENLSPGEETYSLICVSENGITRIGTNGRHLGSNFPIAISATAATYLKGQGLNIE